jgi:hypothetical protein
MKCGIGTGPFRFEYPFIVAVVFAVNVGLQWSLFVFDRDLLRCVSHALPLGLAHSVGSASLF